MSAQLSDYINLITSEHRDKPKYVALLSMFAQWAVDLRTLYASLPGLFDIDTAIGAQLDDVALWTGATRRITIEPTILYPAPADPYVYVLTDAELRAFARGRIVANFWDGSPNGIVPIYEAYFGGSGQYAAIVDNEDMTITIYLTGVTPTPAQLAIISQFLLPTRPAGVLLDGIWIAGGGPLFGLDVSNNFLDGPDRGYFGIFQPGP